MARRLWTRFEVLPFRYGVALAVGTAGVVVLLVTGFMTLGGGPDEHGAPGSVRRSPVEAAAPPAPTWSSYVSPRHAKPSPVPARPRTASNPPRPRPTHESTRPSSTVTCPPSLKRWTWVWEMCKRNQSG
ncbi:MAG: hypothetical protein ACRDP6_37635 [Actinoallomurus sp.]